MNRQEGVRGRARMEDRLVLFLDELYTRVGRKYYGRHATLLFLLEVARHFREASLFLTIKDAAAPDPDEPLVADLTGSSLQVTALPPYRSLAASLLKMPAALRILRRHRREIQEARALFIRVPSLVGLALGELSRGWGQEPCFHVCANIETQANPVTRGGPGEVLWRRLARLINLLTQWAGRGLKVSVVGAELVARFSRGAPLIPCPRAVMNIFESVQSETLFRFRPDTCQAPMVRLLRVCQLSPSKGLEVLLPALRLLVDLGMPVRLDVVGGAAPDYLRELQSLTNSLGLSSLVAFLGPLDYEALHRQYREADIQVISSWGEGLPRVILEGWGACLPLVSTSVGGIPALVKDGESGLLVPPGDPEALARAVTRMIEDGALRRRTIASGFAQAREFSRERQSARLAEFLKEN